MRGFYWLIEGELAGCSCPGSERGGGESALANDLAWLRERGVRALLTLTESPLPAEALAEHDLEALHLPVPDLYPPTPDQLARALAFIDAQHLQGRPIAVHCLMGQGRTGTVLAAYLIRAGATVDDALAELRAVCPGAVENPAQVHALEAYATRRDWIL